MGIRQQAGGDCDLFIKKLIMTRQTVFGTFSKTTNQNLFAVTLTILRIALGILFLFAGITKLGDWTASGYLMGVTGPFAGFFQSLAGSVVVDQLNIWGLLFIGISLILGLFVRPASFFGIVVMLLYYLSGFEHNTASGLIDQHIIYILTFLVFLSGGIGHIYGLDGLLYRSEKKRKLIKEILFG